MELFNQDVMKKRGLRRAFFFIAARLANYINYDCFKRKRIGMCHLVWAMEYYMNTHNSKTTTTTHGIKTKSEKETKKGPEIPFERVFVYVNHIQRQRL